MASLVLVASMASPLASYPADAAIPRMIQGGVGLIDMPSARFAEDGELSASLNFFQNTQHYSLNFQALPWLETSFRYSGLAKFDPLFPVYYDRSFAMKARLWRESAFFPSVAIGINDLVGTGVYSGEFVVASKAVGGLDFTLGMGWGRLGSSGLFKNPFTIISNKFGTRPGFNTPGATNFNSFFRGPTSGLFGGVVWKTPVENLSLIAEYSSDTYAVETLRGNFEPKSQLNFGASYEIFPGITIGVQWLYGRAISGNLSFAFDPTKPQYPATLRPAPPPPAVRSADQRQQALESLLRERNTPAGAAALRLPPPSPAPAGNFVDALFARDEVREVEIRGNLLRLAVLRPSPARCAEYAALSGAFGLGVNSVQVANDSGPAQTFRCTVSTIVPLLAPVYLTEDAAPEFPSDPRTAEEQIRESAVAQRLKINAVSITVSEVLVYYTNEYYFDEAQAISRLTKILTAMAPPSVERFRLISNTGSLHVREFTVLRAPLERALSAPTGMVADAATLKSGPAPMQNPVFDSAAAYPAFTWNIYPQLRQSLFDPDQPLGFHLTANLEGAVELWKGLALRGIFEVTAFENFNRNRPSDSLLPRVRSEYVNYLIEGKHGISNLQLDYHFRLSPTVFAVAKAGYLESMFAGAGGEVLWRPEGARWALGGDFYHLRQRSFDRLFGVRDYSVNTGHVSLYYESPWYDLNFAVRAGQYLAGDRGVTFEVSRRFSTGVEIGAFMTKTNVSSQQFGEGSFDKGIIIRIPLSWATPIETQSVFSLDLRPVQRDGGQRLLRDVTLYADTRRQYSEKLISQAGNILP